MKRTNTLPLSPVVLTRPYCREHCYLLDGELRWRSGRALASNQCDPGSIPGPGVIFGLSLLLVLYSAPRVFLLVLRFSSLLKNQHF